MHSWHASAREALTGKLHSGCAANHNAVAKTTDTTDKEIDGEHGVSNPVGPSGGTGQGHDAKNDKGIIYPGAVAEKRRANGTRRESKRTLSN